MELKNFGDLLNIAQLGPSRRMVAVAANDPHTVEACLMASRQLGITPILVGDFDRISMAAKGIGADISHIEVVHCGSDEDSACAAVALIREDRGDFLLKGALQTPTLLRAVVDKERGLRRQDGIMSHTAVIENPFYPKLVGLTDGGMIPHPDFDEKIKIIENSLALYHALGYKNPKIAVLAASETVSKALPETVDAQRLTEHFANRDDCTVYGPLSFDLAMNRESCNQKCYSGPIAADADLLVSPDISSGNMTVKAMLLSGAKMSGCILGAACSIALVSRSASAQEKLASIALCQITCG